MVILFRTCNAAKMIWTVDDVWMVDYSYACVYDFIWISLGNGRLKGLFLPDFMFEVDFKLLHFYCLLRKLRVVLGLNPKSWRFDLLGPDPTTWLLLLSHFLTIKERLRERERNFEKKNFKKEKAKRTFSRSFLREIWPSRGTIIVNHLDESRDSEPARREYFLILLRRSHKFQNHKHSLSLEHTKTLSQVHLGGPRVEYQLLEKEGLLCPTRSIRSRWTRRCF